MAADNRLSNRHNHPVGRAEKVIAVTDEITAFAADLRKLRADAGGIPYRQLAASTHYSHATLSEATGGVHLPSLPVLMAFVEACKGDVDAWRCRWERLRAANQPPAQLLPAWPEQPPADGSDPEAAGCAADATTLTARKIAYTGRQLVLAQVELRHSPSRGAVWGRLEGYGSLDNIARVNDVEVVTEVVRHSDGARQGIRDPYCFDYHWSDLLIAGTSLVHAQAFIYADGELIGQGETLAWPEPS